MISSTSYRNRVRPARLIGFAFLFVLALGFAYGIGYKMGQDSMSPMYQATPRPISVSSSRPSPAMEKSSLVWASAGKSKYTLYLAAFPALSDAEKEKTRLEGRGLRGIEIVEVRRPATGQTPWYRLGYGRFDSQDAAVEEGRQLTERGMIRDFWPKELL